MATAAQLAPLVLVLLLLLQPAFSASLVEPLDCPTMVCKLCIITTAANCNENAKYSQNPILSDTLCDSGPALPQRWLAFWVEWSSCRVSQPLFYQSQTLLPSKLCNTDIKYVFLYSTTPYFPMFKAQNPTPGLGRSAANWARRNPLATSGRCWAVLSVFLIFMYLFFFLFFVFIYF